MRYPFKRSDFFIKIQLSMALKSIYSFTAPIIDDLETLVMIQLMRNFDKATIKYEFEIDYQNFIIPTNKYTNEKEIYIHTKKISNISDFYKLKNILIGLGFIEGCSL